MPASASRRSNRRSIATLFWGALLVAAACDRLSGLFGGESPAGESRVAWKYNVLGELTVPAFDDSLAFFAAANHQVFALDKRTGAARWASPPYNGGIAPGTALVVIGDVVVYPDYDIYAFDRATGALRWVFRDGPEGNVGHGALDRDGTRVYAGSTNGFAFAIGGTDGHLAWKSTVATDTTPTRVFDPMVDGDLVAVVYTRATNPVSGGVAALERSTGAVRWRRELLPATPGQPSGGWNRAGFSGALVIVPSTNGSVHAFDRITGDEVWKRDRPAALRPTEGDDQRLVVANGVVVVASAGLTTLSGLDAATGAQLWQRSPGRGSIVSPMTAVGDVVYLTYLSGQLSAVNAQNGATLWEVSVGAQDPLWMSPAADTSYLFVPGAHGFYAIRR
ncbi:MAG: PQQ-binding-like beta-propeller repeat protein [Gemmatimonadetes bacterium]|nr:PQQ-binding-like beta-propeller repeat protein [Gemmatimonadota bacterium]